MEWKIYPYTRRQFFCFMNVMLVISKHTSEECFNPSITDFFPYPLNKLKIIFSIMWRINIIYSNHRAWKNTYKNCQQNTTQKYIQWTHTVIKLGFGNKLNLLYQLWCLTRLIKRKHCYIYFKEHNTMSLSTLRDSPKSCFSLV